MTIAVDDQYCIPADRFENLSHIEDRVARTLAQDQGPLRSVLKCLYLFEGPTNIPRDRLKQAHAYLDPAEVVLTRWLATRVSGSLRARYGKESLRRARLARYRCETCLFPDVRALHLDHVHGLLAKQFACLCANCHNIKSRKDDWDGTKKYASKE
jgi:hypothetical protein